MGSCSSGSEADDRKPVCRGGAVEKVNPGFLTTEPLGIPQKVGKGAYPVQQADQRPL